MQQDELKSIGRRIKELRMQRGMSQVQLAKEIGLSQTNLSNVERGRTGATLANLLKIRSVLKCKMADFFVNIDGVPEAADKVAEDIELEDVLAAIKLLKKLKS